jgi:hypothetical protein
VVVVLKITHACDICCVVGKAWILQGSSGELRIGDGFRGKCKVSSDDDVRCVYFTIMDWIRFEVKASSGDGTYQGAVDNNVETDAMLAPFDAQQNSATTLIASASTLAMAALLTVVQ